MSAKQRLMIFGLHRDDDEPTVRRLIERFPADSILIEPVPGDNDQAVALVRIPAEPVHAARMVSHVSACRHRGRRLVAWVSHMPWR